ncbi:unnamed protein product, partial [Closterium sp. NIES-54]
MLLLLHAPALHAPALLSFSLLALGSLPASDFDRLGRKEAEVFCLHLPSLCSTSLLLHNPALLSPPLHALGSLPASDFDRLGRKEVEAFFQQHYTPDKLTCAVVGDVSAAEVERLATKYFAPWQPIFPPSQPIPALPFSLASSSSPLLLASAFPLPLSSSTPLASTPPSLNPTSISSSSSASPAWRSGSREEGWEAARMAAAAVGEEREMRMSVGANPLYFEGYFRPSSSSVDDPVISVISSLLYGSRSSRLYKNLVLPGKALSASATETYPGDKRPSLFLLSAFPPLGGTTDAVAAALQEQLQHMADTRVPESDLARVRKSLRVGFL